MPAEQLQPDQTGDLEDEAAALSDEARALDLDATDIDTEHLQRSAQAERSRGIDLLGLKRRKAERAQKKEAEKSEIFREVNSLVEGHGQVRDVLRKRRLEQDYGKGRIGKLNAKLACADVANGPTFMQEAKARLKKLGIKTAITGTLGVVGGAALGTVSWPVLLTALAAGTAGRGAVELYRLFKGDERRQKKEIAKVEEAMADKITELIDNLNEMQIRKQTEDPELDIMSDPEYKKQYLEIVELMYDSSKARVQVIGEGDDQVYVGLGKEESYTEGAKQLNYGELRTQARKGEKKAETVANWTAMMTSLLGGLAAGAHLASDKAAEAASNATGAARSTLENGGTITVDFNGDDIAHKVTLLRDAQQHLTDKLIYLKDAAHKTGEHLASGIPNPDQYTSGDILSKLGDHWHDVGTGYQELYGMLEKAASSGAYNQAWIENAKAILAAGAAFFGQAMAEPTVSRFSESDESKRKKVEQAMAKYKHVLGGDSDGGEGNENSDQEETDDDSGGAPQVTVVEREGEEEGIDEESGGPDTAGPPASGSQVEAEKSVEANDEERAARFWRRFDIAGEKADGYRATQKEYMEYMIASMAGSGKLILDIPKSGRNNEDYLDRLAAYRVMALEMGYEIGEFEPADDKDEASIKKTDGVDIVPPVARTLGEEPALSMSFGEGERDVETEERIRNIYERAGTRSPEEAQRLISEAKSIIEAEKAAGEGKLKPTIGELEGSGSFVDKDVVYLKGDCEAIFIGDTHGDPLALRAILNQANFFQKIANGEPIKVVMLGDYADRGTADLENLEQVLNLKTEYPNNVILLQGNHEEERVNGNNTNGPAYLRNTLKVKYGEQKGEEVYRNYLDIFSSMPNAVVTENGVVAMHGGIGDFTNLNDLQDNEEALHWSDPPDYIGMPGQNIQGSGVTASDRGAGFIFGRDALEKFLSNSGAKVLVRAHQSDPFVAWDGKIATIFSNGNGSEHSHYGRVKDPNFALIDLRKPIEKLDESTVKSLDYSQAKNIPEIRKKVEQGTAVEAEPVEAPPVKVVLVEKNKMTLENAEYDSIGIDDVYFNEEKNMWARITAIDPVDDNYTIITVESGSVNQTPDGNPAVFTSNGKGEEKIMMTNTEWAKLF